MPTHTQDLDCIPCPTEFLAPLPEAACSINVRFSIPGYLDGAQATGRGATPQDAVRNLLQTMETLRMALTALPSREERAAALLARGTMKALAAQDYGRLDRLTKAYVLAVRGYVEEVILEDKPHGVWRVHSQSEPTTTFYTVQGRSCDCPDARRHAEEAEWWCKHSLAVCIVRELARQEQTHE